MNNIYNLVNEAKEIANNNFCCKHSNYTVGAILVCKSGKRYSGFNIENNGIQSICAERVAFSKALTDMEKSFECIIVVGKKVNSNKFEKTIPCGYCRQFISEYTNNDFQIYTYDDEKEELYKYTIEELLPEKFSL